MPQPDRETGFFATIWDNVLKLCCGCCLIEEDDLEPHDYSRAPAQNVDREILPNTATSSRVHQSVIFTINEDQSSRSSAESRPVNAITPSTTHQGDLLRQKARDHFNEFKILQRRAREAKLLKNQPRANSLFQQANREKQLWEQANAAAASAFLDENCPQNANQNTIDLHHLYVKEAIIALDLFIDNHIDILRREKKKSVSLMVITGRGKHSAEGPKIKPAVLKRLAERELEFSLSNPGRLRVLVSNKALFSREL